MTVPTDDAQIFSGGRYEVGIVEGWARVGHPLSLTRLALEDRKPLHNSLGIGPMGRSPTVAR